MDMIMLDITDVPGVEVDDEVTLIGEQGSERITADEVGALCGTISYEVLAGIMARVPRLYIEDGGCPPSMTSPATAPHLPSNLAVLRFLMTLQLNYGGTACSDDFLLPSALCLLPSWRRPASPMQRPRDPLRRHVRGGAAVIVFLVLATLGYASRSRPAGNAHRRDPPRKRPPYPQLRLRRRLLRRALRWRPRLPRQRPRQTPMTQAPTPHRPPTARTNGQKRRWR